MILNWSVIPLIPGSRSEEEASVGKQPAYTRRIAKLESSGGNQDEAQPVVSVPGAENRTALHVEQPASVLQEHDGYVKKQRFGYIKRQFRQSVFGRAQVEAEEEWSTAEQGAVESYGSRWKHGKARWTGNDSQ